jgi:hypothetical protein
LPGTFAGIIVRLDGAEPHDRTPADDPAVNPLSQGIPNFDFYSMEVVQRIGYDSFCPDNGVLFSKNKDKESRNGGPNGFNCFNWVIDAHPEDINMVDYIKPDGHKVMRTIADYRQLNDALFHAGTNSGSFNEWTDEHNRLHFYIIDIEKNEEGILSYEIGVRSLDGSGPQKRSLSVSPPPVEKVSDSVYVFFTVKNTSENSATLSSFHSQDTSSRFTSEILRMSVNTENAGWSAQLMNNFISLKPGETSDVPVYVTHEERAAGKTKINLTVQSESDPDIVVVASKAIKR